MDCVEMMSHEMSKFNSLPKTAQDKFKDLINRIAAADNPTTIVKLTMEWVEAEQQNNITLKPEYFIEGVTQCLNIKE